MWLLFPAVTMVTRDLISGGRGVAGQLIFQAICPSASRLPLVEERRCAARCKPCRPLCWGSSCPGQGEGRLHATDCTYPYRLSARCKEHITVSAQAEENRTEHLNQCIPSSCPYCRYHSYNHHEYRSDSTGATYK